MEENVTMMTVLQELRDFRAENNKRWEENDRRWEQNEKRLAAVETKVESIQTRVEDLEKGRITDRRSILDVIETMQKSIDGQFKEMKEYMDLKFDKIDLARAVNEAEHRDFKKLLKAYGIRLDFFDTRLQSLERWRKDIEDGGFVGVY